MVVAHVSAGFVTFVCDRDSAFTCRFRVLIVKAVLHCNFFSNLSRNAVATKIAEELHGVVRNVARSRTQFYDCSNFQSPSHSVTTPPATCLAGLRVAGNPIAQCNTPVRATGMQRA